MSIGKHISSLWDRLRRGNADVVTAPSQEAWIAFATHGVGIGIWEWNVPRQELLWDDTVYELFGVRRDSPKTPSEHWRSAVLPEDIKRVLAEENALCRYGREVCTTYRIRLPDGSVRHIGSRGAVERDENRRPIRMIGICEDITERIETKCRLEQERLLADQTSRMARVGGWSMDCRTNTVFWTDEVYRIHQEPLGIPIKFEDGLSYYTEESRPKIRHAVEQCIANGTPYELELQIVTAKGHLRWVRTMGESKFVEGRCVLLSGAFQDITEQYQARHELELARQVAEAASSSKSEFLANMSHELRTPLTAILGYAEIAIGQRGNWEAVESSIQTVRSNGEHLLAVINDLLDLSKIEAGKMTLEQEPTPVRAILQEVSRQHRIRAERKGLQFEVRLTPDVPEMVICDPTRLRQMLHNLLGNAVKFTDAGTVSVEASFTPAEQCQERGSLQIVVVDSGVGMTSAQLQRVFAPFEQADASTTRRFGGSGLGLSVTQRLSKMLGGTLRAESTLGVGSRFELALTVHVVKEVAVQQEQRITGLSLVGSMKPLEGYRVLLVDDSPDIQRLMTHILSHSGALVEIASDGELAIEMVRVSSTPYDLILMDMQMPKLDGYKTTKQLRAKGVRVPVIAVTAHAMSDDKERCLQAGCDAYTTKPINRAELIKLCVQLAQHEKFDHERKMAG